MSNKSIFKFFTFLSIILFLTFQLHSQEGLGKGRISGKVEDEAGNPIKDAAITAQSMKAEVKLEVNSDEKGDWAILGLGTGFWRVTAAAKGYAPSFVEINARQLRRNPPIVFVLKKIATVTDMPVIEDESTVQLFEQGIQFFSEKKYDEAIAAFQDFLQKNPSVYQVRINIGNCYKEKGEFDKALEQYNLVIEEVKNVKGDIKEDDAVAKALAATGEVYLKKEDYETAQSYLLQAIELYPKDETLAYNIGEIYFSSGKMDEAIKYLEMATHIKEDWGKPYLKLGYVHLNKAEYGKSIEYFNKFLEIEPESPEAPAIRNLSPHLEKMIKQEE